MSAKSAQSAVLGTDLPRRPDKLAGAWMPWLIWGYGLLLVVGALLFHSELATVRGNDMSWGRAIFTTANALALGGFQQSLSPSYYQPPGQWAVLLLTQAGTFFALVVGGWALVRLLRLPYRDGQIVFTALFCQAVALLLGALLLGETTRPLVGPSQTAAALANSGVVLGALPALNSWRTHLILLPLAVLGGLGLPVLLEIKDSLLHGRALSFHSRTVLGLSAGLYLFALLVLLLLQWTVPGGGEAWINWRTAPVAASTAAVVTRTAGLPYDFATLLPNSAAQFFALVLMLIGASPAGTGGGIKTTTLAELFRGVRRALANHPAGKPFALAAIWLAGYLLLTGLCLLLLLQFEPQLPPDRMLFLAVSAASCVGLSHNPITLSTPGLLVLSAALLLGRTLPLALLWWQARTSPQADLAVA